MKSEAEDVNFIGPGIIYSSTKAINVGQGAAVCLNIGLNKVGERNVIMPLFLNVNDNLSIRIFSDEARADIKGEYELSFSMQDIYKNNYLQIFKLHIDAKNVNLDVVSEDSTC